MRTELPRRPLRRHTPVSRTSAAGENPVHTSPGYKGEGRSSLQKPGGDFIGAEAAAGADPACHFRVSPKLPGQFSVVLFPLREAHPICLQKKILIMKDPPVSLFSFS